MLRRILTGFAVIIGVSLIAFSVFYVSFIRPRVRVYEDVRSMIITDVDVARVADGVYEGAFSYADTGVKVRVSVAGGWIQNIEILEGGRNPHGKRAEVITDDITKANSLNVDVISGATTTSKALLKAVELALLKGIAQQAG